MVYLHFINTCTKNYHNSNNDLFKLHSKITVFRLNSLEMTNSFEWTISALTAPEILADLTGSSLVKMGADARLSSGAYTVARVWAQSLNYTG